jgi:hypothetical protein
LITSDFLMPAPLFAVKPSGSAYQLSVVESL